MSLTDRYNGNPFLRKAGSPVAFTGDQILERRKCRNDYKYFINNYCKIVSLDHGLIDFKLYPCQENKLDVIHENRKTIVMEARQSGKCVESTTKYKIRNKQTGEILYVTAEEFHEMCSLRSEVPGSS